MKSYLNQISMNAPLASTSIIKPRRAFSQKALVATLILTSLVDAFSILVIYLLMNTSAATESLDLEKNLTLPMATQSEALQAGAVVTTINGQYKIKDQTYEQSQLFDALQALHEELKSTDDQRSSSLVIQADKLSSFEMINPIILAGTQSGFSTIKFAVMPDNLSKEGGQ